MGPMGNLHHKLLNPRIHALSSALLAGGIAGDLTDSTIHNRLGFRVQGLGA